MLSERLLELSAGGEPDDEGNPTTEALILRLEKLMPPKPPPALLGPDGRPLQ